MEPQFIMYNFFLKKISFDLEYRQNAANELQEVSFKIKLDLAL